MFFDRGDAIDYAREQIALEREQAQVAALGAVLAPYILTDADRTPPAELAEAEREEALIAQWDHDVRTRWDVTVGPLHRRKSDGKLIRLPDRGNVSSYDAQVAMDAYFMGRGPGRVYGVQAWYVEIAREVAGWSDEQRAEAKARAERNEATHRANVEASEYGANRPPAPPPITMLVPGSQSRVAACPHHTAPHRSARALIARMRA